MRQAALRVKVPGTRVLAKEADFERPSFLQTAAVALKNRHALIGASATAVWISAVTAKNLRCVQKYRLPPVVVAWWKVATAMGTLSAVWKEVHSALPVGLLHENSARRSTESAATTAELLNQTVPVMMLTPRASVQGTAVERAMGHPHQVPAPGLACRQMLQAILCLTLGQVSASDHLAFPAWGQRPMAVKSLQVLAAEGQ